MAGRHGGNSNLKKGNKMEQQNQIEIKQNQLRAVVAEMPQKFDSHDVIKPKGSVPLMRYSGRCMRPWDVRWRSTRRLWASARQPVSPLKT